MVGRPLDDRELVARAKRGDADAYEELVHAYQGIALRTAYLIAGNAPDAEEAAQDAFREGAPRALAISYGCAVQAVAAADRRQRGPQPSAVGRPPGCACAAGGRGSGLGGRASGDAAPSPEAALLGAERREELVAALNRLGEADREALACRYFLDLSEAETAAALGVRPGTVKSRLSRALERLRAELEDGE